MSKLSTDDILRKAQVKVIPDVIEAKLIRHGAQAELCYREYFTYLPKEVQDYIIAVGIRVNELLYKSIGCEVKIQRIEQGIEIRIITLSSAATCMFMSELLVFGATNISEAKILTESSLESGRNTLSTGLILRNWDENARNFFFKYIYLASGSAGSDL